MIFLAAAHPALAAPIIPGTPGLTLYGELIDRGDLSLGVGLEYPLGKGFAVGGCLYPQYGLDILGLNCSYAAGRNLVLHADGALLTAPAFDLSINIGAYYAIDDPIRAYLGGGVGLSTASSDAWIYAEGEVQYDVAAKVMLYADVTLVHDVELSVGATYTF